MQLDKFAKQNLHQVSNDLQKKRFVQGQKYLFELPNNEISKVSQIASKFNLSFPVAKVLSSRGFESDEQISAYLFSSFEKDVSNANLLKDGSVAIDRILKAIEKKEKILISGDYDVDGITSSALMMVCLLPLGAKINYFLPNREIDGYGLSSKIVKLAKAAGYSLIITVDNGITALSAAKTAAELGIDLIITDHHRPHGELPVALAIVDPNQDDCNYPFKGLPGVGVIFKLISWIYELKNLKLPPKAYELLMLGTIADVAPLQQENRFWVRYGLGKVNKNKSIAMKVLAKNGKLTKEKLSSLDIGFMIAPQINALGRLSDPRDAVKFLISANKNDVETVGKTLLELNESRKKIEREIFNEINNKIDQKEIDLKKENIIVSSGGGWPSGVIGLVAGKLMHMHGRPALIFHEINNGTLKGSARSIKKFNIFDALVQNKDLLLTFGGHSFAAGLSLEQKNLPILKERLENLITSQLTPDDLVQKLQIDAEIDFAEMNNKFLNDLEKLEPFGHHNDQPVFFANKVTLLKPPQLLKEQHVKCMLFSAGSIKPTIFFNRPDLYAILNEIGDKEFSIAGYVTTNEWDGRASIQFQGLDIAI